ncbi:MAG: AsnC family transcriptional regulator, partial [Promethearchaeota archaeon]
MKKEKDLDDIDRSIIRILQENAKTSYREIHEELGISIG